MPYMEWDWSRMYLLWPPKAFENDMTTILQVTADVIPAIVFAVLRANPLFPQDVKDHHFKS